MPRGRTVQRILLLILMGAVICAQSASLTSGFSHTHSSDHCCSLCHAGPLPWIRPAIASAPAPVLVAAWLERSSSFDTAHQIYRSSGDSRAPPVLV